MNIFILQEIILSIKFVVFFIPPWVILISNYCTYMRVHFIPWNYRVFS